MDHQRQLVELLERMHQKREGLANEPNLKYFVVSSRFDGLLLFDCHDYWAHDCNFELQMRTNCWVIKTFVG